MILARTLTLLFISVYILISCCIKKQLYLNFDAKLLGRCFKADLRLVDELGELMLGAAAAAVALVLVGLVAAAVGNVTDEPWGGGELRILALCLAGSVFNKNKRKNYEKYS